MMKYIAHVTWEDIDTECHSANHCPAAAAIQRATGFGWSFVDKRHIFLYNDQVQRMGSVKTPGPSSNSFVTMTTSATGFYAP